MPSEERFDPGIPVEAAWTPPASWYLEEAHLQREIETVFRRHWLCAGRSEQTAQRGHYIATSSRGREHAVVRDDAGDLRAFHNVCRHHGAVLLEGSGQCGDIVCPYHGWTYGQDGRLRRAPRCGAIADFDRADFSLRPLGCEEWGPLVFTHHDPGAAPLAPALGQLLERLDASGLRFVARREFEMECNWKVFVDNYLDGGYHVPVLHGDLSGHLDLETYESEIFATHSVQSCSGHGDERVGKRAVYAWIHPNLMLNRYGPILDTNLVVPLGPHRSRVVFDYWFETAVADDEAFVDESLAASRRVQDEDTMICESVQRGLASGAYDRGRYAPSFEAPMHHFHRLVARDLES